jgi:hypothetical protein
MHCCSGDVKEGTARYCWFAERYLHAASSAIGQVAAAAAAVRRRFPCFGYRPWLPTRIVVHTQ